jgi:hypothetical protein
VGKPTKDTSLDHHHLGGVAQSVTFLKGSAASMTASSSQQWHPCAVCGAPTDDALCGNRVLWRLDVSRLPADFAPSVSWRCRQHQPYHLRAATTVYTNGLGDLVFRLACGHEVQWLFRGVAGYTPAMIAQGLATGRLRLDQPQRCYRCGDLEQDKERKR